MECDVIDETKKCIHLSASDTSEYIGYNSDSNTLSIGVLAFSKIQNYLIHHLCMYICVFLGN